MLTAVDGGRGLRFRLFGFPVRIDVTFLLIAAFLGLGTGEVDIGLMLTWVVLLGGSVLAHELGHAVAARSLGARPSILIHGMGGLTSYVPPRPLTRGESIGVSLAGPGAGFALGLVVLGVALAAPTPAHGSLAELAVRAAIYINLGWGLVNLLPVLPLDGGQILVQLMPGDDETRHHRAAIVSIVTAAVGAVVVWAIGLRFAAVLFVVFGATNLAAARGHRERRAASGEDEHVRAALAGLVSGDAAAVEQLRTIIRTTGREPLRNGLKSTLVEYLAVTDQPGARHELETLPGQVEPAVYALVNLTEAGPHGDLAELIETFHNAPTPLAARAVVMGATHLGHPDAILGAFESGPLGARAEPVLAFAQDAAHRRGAFAAAVELGQLLLRTNPAAGAWSSYNLACSLARLGRTDEALRALDAAIRRGWDDPELLDTDPDLASLRTAPGYDRLRARVS